MANHRIPLAQFVTQRLGSEPEAGVLLKRMLVLSFGAASFRDFWRYWNPVYGYFLYYYCYRPLRRVLPGQLCVLITFACSGFFLHDLPFGWWIRALRAPTPALPFVAVWFSLMGLLVLLTDLLHLNWQDRSIRARSSLNGGCIVLTFLLTLFLQSFS